MHVIKAFFIAFSIYSKIPVPQFEWKEEDMRYTLCFFPLVGAVIGIMEWLWYCLCEKAGVGTLMYAAIGTAIPILISGGFHVDGFMDTMDALHSYQPREKKLEILKDPHIGAFSVIMLLLYYLCYLGVYSELKNEKAFLCFCIGFVLSRAFSGLAFMVLQPAKETGMLSYFAKTMQKNIVKFVLCVEIAACIALMFVISTKAAVFVLLAVLLSFCYYIYKSKKEFGGITGDLAGYFVTVCELCVVVAAMLAGIEVL